MFMNFVEEPKCFTRRCKHFIGIKDGMSEVDERPVCRAFPDGIPDVIAFGDNLHLSPFRGDKGILYERYTGKDYAERLK